MATHSRIKSASKNLWLPTDAAELFSINGFRFGFSLVTRTPEFRKQTGMDNFGSFHGVCAF
jgi:hypothetical protein